MSEPLEAAIARLERCGDPALRETAREVVSGLLALHERALARLLTLARQSCDAGLVERLAADADVAQALLLHGLHPADVASRVAAALETVRPKLRAHGGDARLLAVEGGRAKLELLGACRGCPSSAQTLKDLVEGAVLAAAPELEAVETA